MPLFRGIRETVRPAIAKGVGLTATERYLAKLAERSFLDLWSYPNPYRDQGQPEGGHGKELCDLLVVCGRDVIIFSEKNIAWPPGDEQVAWQRWARRALLDSTKQVRGAERWITQFPDRIFLDPECKQRFPLEFPEADEAVIHQIVVARGSGEVCKRHFGDGIGSLRVRPEVWGDQHYAPEGVPFAVGDLDPSGSFVHVMDDITLDVLLGELDTVLDFTDYLTKKAAFVRAGRLRSAAGEQDLFARYAVRLNEDGDHDFVEWSGSPGRSLDIEPGLYEKLASDPRYLARKEADKPSYFWDRLIESFTHHMIQGTSMVLEGHDDSLSRHELGVRFMALQRRVERRNFGGAVADALVRGASEQMFRRAMIVPPGLPNCETGFFVLTMKRLDWMKERAGYEEYRVARTSAALIYAKGLLVRCPHLDRVVGIACEPAVQGQGGSEELVYVEQAHWSDDDRAGIEEDCRRLGMFQAGVAVSHLHEDEFPEA